MEIKSEVQGNCKNIQYYAAEIRKLFRQQFDRDVEQCDLAQIDGTANEYLRTLAQLDSFAEKIDFHCYCIEKWLADAERLRPPLLKVAEGATDLF